MIDSVLNCVSEKLNEYLTGFYEVPEKLAALGVPGEGGMEESENRIMISLLNVEREAATGISAGIGGGSGGAFVRQPAWHLNIYFVVAAVFEGKRYEDGLRMLSGALGFFQQYGVFQQPGGGKFTVELVSLSIQELSNVWSILGGKYYPSAVCKIRMLTLDGNNVSGTAHRVRNMGV